ncbi:MAG TPA: DUF1801 domain-containing protein [Kofleriaceae bacterium]|nr:DUF1801 domain-containing protein [Kofleriaceae bacterium]
MGSNDRNASKLIDKRIRELKDWRGETLARMRELIHQADTAIVEEWKWRGTPVWSHDGIVCTGESYKNVVKLTFARGAQLADPKGLFNASLEGNTRRAIDIPEGHEVNARAFKALVKAAIVANTDAKKPKPSAKPKRTSRTVLLSGGNPQIAKADGDAPVQAYIAALPGWKRAVALQLDALIVGTLPAVTKAVKWNSPMYGAPGKGWFLGIHAFTRYLKLAFFRGSSLRPLPPGESKSPETRYLDIHEGDELDEKRLARWVKQAAKLPGWITNKR